MAVTFLSPTRETGRLRWRLPARRDINFVLNITLPWLLILSFATGWIASWLGLTEFGLHKWSSIGVFVVALAHLALHWRSLAAHLRRLGGGHWAECRRGLHLVDHELQRAATAAAKDELLRTGS
jgi:predicted ferric reductase